MMMLPSGTGVRVHIAVDMTDMRKGLEVLAMLVQGALKADPFSGHLFAFRGRNANLIKILFCVETNSRPSIRSVRNDY